MWFAALPMRPSIFRSALPSSLRTVAPSASLDEVPPAASKDLTETFPAFLSLQRQKLAAEAMQNRTRGEGGDVANLEDDDEEEMWAKLLRPGDRPTRRLTFQSRP